MTTYTRTILNIGEVIRLWDRGELILQPKFQRRAAWEEDARSYLIDTIVRGLPMPKVYLRRTVNRDTGLTAYEVVDGQQRLRAIIDFRKGKLALRKKHNADFGDAAFNNLPDPTQREFMEYEISTELIEGATDPEIWQLFERLNTYTLTLNRQERLNAKYFGQFKQAAYQLAAEKEALNAWEKLRVFSNRQIARMKEVEMTSDIMIAIIRGISDMADIRKAYADLDEEFPNKEHVMTTFRTALSFVTEHLSEAVRITRFRRLAWFYSLMVSVADAQVGIPNGSGPHDIQSGPKLCQRMYSIEKALKQEEPPPGLEELHDTLSRATSHVAERRIRHSYFYKMLTLSEHDWHSYWGQLTATG